MNNFQFSSGWGVTGDQSQAGQNQGSAPNPIVQAAPIPVQQPQQPVQQAQTYVQPQAPTPPPAQGQASSGYIFGQAWDGFNTTIKLPPHPFNFDENKFLKLLASSISLTKDEKWKIIQFIPKLSQDKINQLIVIFEEEQSKFKELANEHGDHLEKLESKHLAEWQELEDKFANKMKKGEENQKADEIRKNLGL